MTGTHQNGGMRIQYSSNNTALKLITPKKIPLPQISAGILNLILKGKRQQLYKGNPFLFSQSLVLHYTES